MAYDVKNAAGTVRYGRFETSMQAVDKTLELKELGITDTRIFPVNPNARTRARTESARKTNPKRIR
jgi:hypothetical protein